MNEENSFDFKNSEKNVNKWIDWRKELQEMLPNEMNRLDHLMYLIVPENKVPKRMLIDETLENSQNVNKTKIK